MKRIFTICIVWKCRGREHGRLGNGCKNDVMSEEDLFQMICLQTGIRWNGVENVTAETFKNIKTVTLYKDRHIEIEYHTI